MRRLFAWLPRKYQNKLLAGYRKLGRLWIGAFKSYTPERLLETIRALGIREGDTVMLHSAWHELSGFRGSIGDVIDTFVSAVGESGNLVMASLPYRSSAYDYLKTLKCFDVRKTVSAMGLISEFFRRREDVLRSLHPTHPVLARGPGAAALIADHEHCVWACGPGSPFEKLARRDATVLFYNVPFDTFTFFHYIEHIVNDRMPFPLYTDELFDAPCRDARGRDLTVKTYAFSAEAIRRRRFAVLEQRLWRQDLIRQVRFGNSYLLCVRLSEVLDCVEEMMRERVFFYDISDCEFDPQPDKA